MPAAAAGQSGGVGQMGQLAGMPMQLASQAGQVPQGMMQGAQAGMQPMSQLSPIAKAAGASPGSDQELIGEPRSSGDIGSAENVVSGAGAGQPTAETVPDGAASGPSASAAHTPPPIRSQTRAT